jgi:hypothetical protein
MKSRTQPFMAISLVLLVLGITIFTFPKRDQEKMRFFPATIGRDCAPWDGSAFTVSIRYDSASTIRISIWQSPDIKVPSTFSFPDETGRVGQVYILSDLDPMIPLSGKVFFQRGDRESPVEGEFVLMGENGKRFKGKFNAKWENKVVYCG